MSKREKVKKYRVQNVGGMTENFKKSIQTELNAKLRNYKSDSIAFYLEEGLRKLIIKSDIYLVDIQDIAENVINIEDFVEIGKKFNKIEKSFIVFFKKMVAIDEMLALSSTVTKEYPFMKTDVFKIDDIPMGITFVQCS